MTQTPYQGPVLLSHGFRPFFLLGGLAGLTLVPSWLFLFTSGAELPSVMPPLEWHLHEMIFGYLAAVVAGFLLTAVPSWTGRLPLSGRPLGLLVLMWLAGRAVVLAPLPAVPAVIIDTLFLALVAVFTMREILAGKNWRNLPVCLLVCLLALGHAAYHLPVSAAAHDGAVRAALALLTILIALIGGRIVPNFTSNWLIKRAHPARPVPFNRFDGLCLAATAAACVFWVILPNHLATGCLMLAAAALQAMRLARWKALAARDNALVLVLHVAYVWLPVGLLLMAFAILFPGWIPGQSAAIHALTAGLMGMMTLAVMTRATLGHTGRDLAAGKAGTALYIAAFMAAALRVAAPFGGTAYMMLLGAAGGFWVIAFLIFVLVFGKMLLLPRPAQ